jgi:biopolymer transport protein ExbD
MAEIDSSGGGKKGGGKKRAKKASTKVDMTPMVDLGFLLITFFMLTTTFNKPKAMDLVMPDKDKDATEEDLPPVKCSSAITILLGKNHKVFWYECPEVEGDAPQLIETDFSPNGIRKVLVRKGKEVGKEKFVAVIKPLETSKYVDMVDILDEMKISDTKRYAIVDIAPDEKEMVKDL